MSSMRLPFLLLAAYSLCDRTIAATADASTYVAADQSQPISTADLTEDGIPVSTDAAEVASDDAEAIGDDSEDTPIPSPVTEDIEADAVDSGDESDDGNSDNWLGQEYGVIVAIPPRLSEPPDMDPSDWIPTINPELSIEVVQPEEVNEGWVQDIVPDFDEVIKKAVQNIYPLPEPLLAKALALTDDPTTEVTRRLQVQFNQARKRALLADAELRRLSGEQKVFISKLLQDSGTTPSESSSTSSESEKPSTADVSGSADEEKRPKEDEDAASADVGSADLEKEEEEDSEAAESEDEDSETTSKARPTVRPSTGASSIVSSTKVASKSTKPASDGDDSQVTSESLVTKDPLKQVNDVLSSINQALGGATTSTVSPPVAIAQGVQNFINGLNLLAIQLAKESS